MTDILDTLDDVEEETEEDVLTGEDVEESGEDDLSESKARDITEAIKSIATATFGLLHQAYKHKAHKALGYSSWEKYVKEEFQMSKSRSYQLIAQAETIEAIKEITPEGTEVKLSEAEIRDLKSELPRITEIISQETSDMSPEEADDFINELIDREREQAQADQKAINEKKAAEKEATDAGYQNALDDVADNMLSEGEEKGKAFDENGVVMEPDGANSFSDDADSGLFEYDVEGNGDSVSAEDALNLYNFFNMLAMATSLPEPEYIIELITDDRMGETMNQLPEAASWINRAYTILESKQ